uniref:Uncharacterized protein n=1 Tax=Lepeophtheirus salmonis TaxID=72036 RepID=A0A0K2UR50_LEPSM
MIDISQGMKSN